MADSGYTLRAPEVCFRKRHFNGCANFRVADIHSLALGWTRGCFHG
jgi:hypothetical protein